MSGRMEKTREALDDLVMALGQYRAASHDTLYVAALAEVEEWEERREELEEEIVELNTPPNGWGPAEQSWHQFHLDQTDAQRVRAEKAEAERDDFKQRLQNMADRNAKRFQEIENIFRAGRP